MKIKLLFFFLSFLFVWNCENQPKNTNEELFLILRSNRGKLFASSDRKFPTLLPIVRQALPKSLKNIQTTSSLSKNYTPTQTASELSTIFKDTYTDTTSGVTETGFLGTKIASLDKRIQEAADNLDNSCFSKEASSYTVRDTDLGLSDYGLQISLDLQCQRKKNEYSGFYGIKDKKASSFVRLTNAGDVFHLLGNVYDYGTDEETAEFFQFDFSAQYSYYIISKAIAKSKKNQIEFVGVAIKPENFATPSSTSGKRFGCGFRFVSNGSVIKVEANVPNSSGIGACISGNPTVVEACLNAEDNSVLSASECSSLQFTLSNQILKTANLPAQNQNMLGKFQDSSIPSGLGDF